MPQNLNNQLDIEVIRNMKLTHFSFVVLLFISLSSCVTSNRQDVRPGIDGLHRVIIRVDDITEGSREAVKQADAYCMEINKQAFFFNDEGKGKGAPKPAANAPTANPAAGKAAAPAAGGEDSEASSVSAEKKYTVDMLFKCL